MDWEVKTFVGVGPIKFGMNPAEVAYILGSPEDLEETGKNLVEYREINLPIIRYLNGTVAQIEAFYDVKNVFLVKLNCLQKMVGRL